MLHSRCGIAAPWLLAFALMGGLAGCSSGDNQAQGQFGSRPGASGPKGDAMPGTPAWYAWVDQNLGMEQSPTASKPGSEAWNQEVQKRLGTRAPNFPVGSDKWRSAIDVVLRSKQPAQ